MAAAFEDGIDWVIDEATADTPINSAWSTISAVSDESEAEDASDDSSKSISKKKDVKEVEGVEEGDDVFHAWLSQWLARASRHLTWH